MTPKDRIRLVDTCEFNTVCFSEIVSELRRIVSNQAFIIEILLKVLDALKVDNLNKS